MTDRAAVSTLKSSHLIVTAIFAAIGIIGSVKTLGANDRTLAEHERRISEMERKFELALERQAVMAESVAVIRERIEHPKHTP